MQLRRMDEPSRNQRITGHQWVHPWKLERSRQFRKEPTGAEAAAWALLRKRRFFGLKWRRQQVIDGFIVDFYCPALRLVLEVDGSSHDSEEAMASDSNRSAHFRNKGLMVARVRNESVDNEGLTRAIEAVVGFPLSVYGGADRG